MFGFRRKKKDSAPTTETTKEEATEVTADTFMEATNGGWSSIPDTLATNGGSSADYVRRSLENARLYAVENNIAVGEDFEFTLKEIPKGIQSPHEILFGLMMQASQYGLSCTIIHDEKMSLTRTS